MSIHTNKKYFLTTFFLLILAEIFSYLGWSYPAINTIYFCLIILATLILSWRKLEYGLYLLFAELFVGSFGYLFSLTINGFRVSVRMGIFVVVMLVWLKNVILKEAKHSEESRDKSDKTLNNIFLSLRGIPRPALVGLGMITFVLNWAFIWGLIRGNSFQNVFFDFNNWLYFLVAFPILFVLHNYNHPASHSLGTPPLKGGDSKAIFLQNILSILSAAVLLIGLKTIILFYLFTHGFVDIGSEIYRWVRDTRIGEITALSGGLYRIFIQSQIYSLLLFCILFCNSFRMPQSEFISGSPPGELSQNKEMPKKARHDSNKFFPITYYLLSPFRRFLVGILIISFTTILLSLSRSYWLALVITLFLYLFITLIFNKNLVAFLLKIVKIILLFLVSLVLIGGVLMLPPKKSYDLSVLIAKRGISNNEPASSSRINQLKPLLLAIAKHPLIGSGFGTTIAYKSDDPRAIQNSKDGSGLVKTYTFEWGYLDMLLKFGLVGLGVYLYIIFLIIKKIFNFKTENYGLQTADYGLQLGFFLALIALLAVNIFSPYLNHPLGIGFVILTFLLCQIKK